MSSLHGLLFLSFCLIFTNAFVYELEFRDEKLFTPCEDKPDMFLDKILDLSKMNFQSLDDGSVHVFGVAEVLVDLKPDNSVQAVFQIYKKNRGNWIHTMFNLQRADFCQAALDPKEFLHKYVPVEEWTCPFYTGQKFVYNATSNLAITLGDPRLAGDYKGTATFSTDGVIIMCTDLYFTVYRI